MARQPEGGLPSGSQAPVEDMSEPTLSPLLLPFLMWPVTSSSIATVPKGDSLELSDQIL